MQWRGVQPRDACVNEKRIDLGGQVHQVQRVGHHRYLRPLRQSSHGGAGVCAVVKDAKVTAFGLGRWGDGHKTLLRAVIFQRAGQNAAVTAMGKKML